MTPSPKGSIMVVDDQPANLKLLEGMLRQEGYAVRSFPRGRMALAAAAQRAPDLILLDITMPEMTGFEVCERLKSSEDLGRIPVIFLSALNEKEDKMRAFRAGGVDYITKPFQFEEVQARVETHLKLHQLQSALKDYNDHLEDQVQRRTRELAEAHERLRILDRSKSDFLSLISHEFRTPLNGLLGVSELLLNESCSTEDINELREMFEASRRRIMTILDHALLLTQIEVEGEKFASERVHLAAVLATAVEQATEFAQTQQVMFETAPPPTGFVLGAADLLKKAFRAVLETAVKLSRAGETVRITCEPLHDVIRVAITSCGRTIPADAIPKFFDLFSVGQAITSEGNLGLDPPLAHRILALSRGSIAIENQHPAGTKMTVSLKPATEQ